MARFQSRQHQEVVQERVQGRYALLQQRQEFGPERFAGVVQLVRDALDDTEIAANVMHRLTPGVRALIVELSKLFQRVFQILNSSLGFDLLHFGVALSVTPSLHNCASARRAMAMTSLSTLGLIEW